VACDLALHLPDPAAASAAPAEVLAVSLRPWGGSPHRLPVALRRRSTAPDDEQVARLAGAVDAVAGRVGLPVRFVAFDAAKDRALHRAVADRLRSDVADLLEPDPAGALAAVAGARAVVAMRYHAGIAALLGHRPAVLLGYGPKVDALAADVGVGFAAVRWDVPDPAAVADALERAIDQAEDGVLDDALARLRARGDANAAVLERLLERAT
jgi:polysaccharide pyruvyl transferase WcaK-like protein